MDYVYKYSQILTHIIVGLKYDYKRHNRKLIFIFQR